MKNSIFLILLILISCNQDERIINLLKSNDTTDVIIGANEAGRTGNVKYVYLLLNDPYNAQTSTNVRYKGISIYQAKMWALQSILKANPPENITNEPNPTIIKFYTIIAK